jgi:hypothetical protein
MSTWPSPIEPSNGRLLYSPQTDGAVELITNDSESGEVLGRACKNERRNVRTSEEIHSLEDIDGYLLRNDTIAEY